MTRAQSAPVRTPWSCMPLPLPSFLTEVLGPLGAPFAPVLERQVEVLGFKAKELELAVAVRVHLGRLAREHAQNPRKPRTLRSCGP